MADNKIMVDTVTFYKLQELISVRKVNNLSDKQLKVLREELGPKLNTWESEIGSNTFQVVPEGPIVPGHVINIRLQRSSRKSIKAALLLERGVDPEIIEYANTGTETVSIQAVVFDPASTEVMSA